MMADLVAPRRGAKAQVQQDARGPYDLSERRIAARQRTTLQ